MASRPRSKTASMPICSSSVGRARLSLREAAMTTHALHADVSLIVTSPVARQQSDLHATRPETLTGLLERQRAAFLKHGPPSLAERRAKLKKLRTALLARKGAFEAALDADFGHRATHDTAIMEMLALTW